VLYGFDEPVTASPAENHLHWVRGVAETRWATEPTTEIPWWAGSADDDEIAGCNRIWLINSIRRWIEATVKTSSAYPRSHRSERLEQRAGGGDAIVHGPQTSLTAEGGLSRHP
jgi:hypothetical protein